MQWYNYLKCSAILALLFLQGIIYSQSINIQKAPTSPSSEIYQLFRDAQGYIWIGTEEGLYRFDGKNYDYYKSAEYTNPVSGIQQDKEGRIWCRNFAGQIFYAEDNQLKLFKDLSKQYTSILNFTVKFFPEIICFGLGDSFIFSTNFNSGRRKCLDKNTPIIKGGEKILGQLKLHSVIGDSVIFSHYFKGNWSLDKNLVFKRIPSYQNLNNRAIGVFFMGDYYLQPVANYKIDDKYGLFIKNVGSKNSIGFTINFKHELIMDALYLDRGRYLWVGTLEGIKIVDLINKSILPVSYLPNNQVSSIISYGKGLLIGSLEGGLYQVNNLEVYKQKTDGHRIMNLTFNKNVGLLGVSSDGSLFSFAENRLPKKLTKTPLVGDIKLSYNKYNNILSLFHKRLVQYDFNKNALIHYSKGVYNGAFKKQIPITKDWNLTMNSSTLQFSQNNLIIGTPKWDSSIFTLGDYTKEYKFTSLKNINKLYRISEGRSYDFIMDKKSKWIYSANALGLSYFHDGIVENVKHKGKIILAKSLSRVGKNILCGTINGRLLEINGTQIVKDWSALLHHEFGYIKRVVQNGNFIFVQDVKHIYRINIQKQNFENITIPIGVKSEKVNDLIVEKGQVQLATDNGIIYFNEDLDLINETNSKVFLTDILVNDNSVNSEERNFDFGNNNLRFSFRSLDLTASFSKLYKYILEGYDDEWIFTENNAEFAQYKNLKPGSYKFQVYALDINNIPSAAPAVYSFQIKPAYYNTWWFRSLCAILLFIIVGLPIYIRFKGVKKQNQLELAAKQTQQQLAESQLSALRSQMNPHFIFNALNSIQEFIVLNKSKLASSYLGKFADLMRAYLNQSKSEYISLQEEVNTLKLYLEVEKIRFEESLIFTLEIDPKVPLEQIQIPPILLQPYVENAIKHGLLHKKGERRLDIRIYPIDGNYIVCAIKDNGVGREKSMEFNSRRKDKPSSFATSATQSRLDLLNKSRELKIEVEIFDLEEDGNIKGTEVKVSIPK